MDWNDLKDICHECPHPDTEECKECMDWAEKLHGCKLFRERQDKLQRVGFETYVQLDPGEKPMLVVMAKDNILNLDNLPNNKQQMNKAKQRFPGIHSTQMQGFKRGWVIGIDLLDQFPWIKLTIKRKGKTLGEKTLDAWRKGVK